jgi:hypothetical protein
MTPPSGPIHDQVLELDQAGEVDAGLGLAEHQGLPHLPRGEPELRALTLQVPPRAGPGVQERQPGGVGVHNGDRAEQPLGVLMEPHQVILYSPGQEALQCPLLPLSPPMMVLYRHMEFSTGLRVL